MRNLVVVICASAGLMACDTAIPRSADEVGSTPVQASGEVKPSVALDGEGLRFFHESGRSTLVGFGSSRETAVIALTAALGPSTGSTGFNADCGASVINWRPGLAFLFDAQGLAGWSSNETGLDRLTTASGIGVGSTRADVEAAYVADIRPTTIGTEFSTAGLAGLLEGRGQDAIVTHIWAGKACIFR